LANIADFFTIASFKWPTVSLSSMSTMNVVYMFGTQKRSVMARRPGIERVIGVET